MVTPALMLREIQRRTAMVAVGATTVHGAGGAGTVAAARAHLARLNLRRIVVRSEKRFRNALDRETLALARALPRGSRHWGLARKLLNIFLRDALYNVYLSNAYAITRIERWLELPLDSHVGKNLQLEMRGVFVPKWKTIKGLTPNLSASFQAIARTVAEAKGIAPVHLDLFLWRPHG
jgi:hypothetical protein